MRDEQVRRYARHILLPDVGGLGQTALMVSAARVELHESDPAAELICAQYLAAGGVGTIVLRGATDDQTAEIASRAGDAQIVRDGPGRDIGFTPRPTWWPVAAPPAGDATALAFWRGSMAALRWMAAIANQ